MGVHAGATDRRRRVRDELGERHRFVAEVVGQVVRCQAEPLGEEPQQPIGECPELAEPGEDELAVSRQHLVGEPLVRAEQPEIRGLDLGIARRPLGPQVDLFADVGTVVRRLGADGFPSPEVARGPLVDEQLVGLGQGEERPHRVEDALDEHRVDTVVGDDEEPDLVADLAHLVGERRTAVDRGQIEDRDLGELPGRHASILRTFPTLVARAATPPGPPIWFAADTTPSRGQHVCRRSRPHDSWQTMCCPAVVVSAADQRRSSGTTPRRSWGDRRRSRIANRAVSAWRGDRRSVVGLSDQRGAAGGGRLGGPSRPRCGRSSPRRDVASRRPRGSAPPGRVERR